MLIDHPSDDCTEKIQSVRKKHPQTLTKSTCTGPSLTSERRPTPLLLHSSPSPFEQPRASFSHCSLSLQHLPCILSTESCPQLFKLLLILRNLFSNPKPTFATSLFSPLFAAKFLKLCLYSIPKFLLSFSEIRSNHSFIPSLSNPVINSQPSSY